MVSTEATGNLNTATVIQKLCSLHGTANYLLFATSCYAYYLQVAVMFTFALLLLFGHVHTNIRCSGTLY